MMLNKMSSMDEARDDEPSLLMAEQFVLVLSSTQALMLLTC